MSNPAMTKLYALTSASGTACSETVLTAEEYADPEIRARAERQAIAAFPPGHIDRPIPGSWVDVSDNEACQLDQSDDDD